MATVGSEEPLHICYPAYFAASLYAMWHTANGLDALFSGALENLLESGCLKAANFAWGNEPDHYG